MADQPDEEEVRGRKRPGNVMKGADTTFLYAESKAARFVEKSRHHRSCSYLSLNVPSTETDGLVRNSHKISLS